jgi:hypothetical protein
MTDRPKEDSDNMETQAALGNIRVDEGDAEVGKGATWVVVYVYRGLISNVEAYDNLLGAQDRMEELKRDANIMNDDLGVYEVLLNKRYRDATSALVSQ